MDRDDKIDHLKNLIDGCFVPELTHNLGTYHLDKSHFDAFRQTLDHLLFQIFDLIQHNEDLLHNTENDTLQLRCKFLLLLCEQTASGTLYQTKDPNLLSNLRSLNDKHFEKIAEVDTKLIDAIFGYYKERLRGNSWKRHLGAIHGFEQFCKLHYTTCKQLLNRDLCTFVLSVSLLVEEFYEPAYKEMSFRLMNVILTRTAKDDIYQLNLHNVVYEILFKDIPKITTPQGTVTMWNCLNECIALMNITNYSKWNKQDDLFEALVRRITFESSSKTCIDLLLLFPKFCLIGTLERLEWSNYEADLDNFEKHDENIRRIREKCAKFDISIFYRWTKRFLKLLIAESHRLFGGEDVAVRMIYAMQIGYIVCISTVPVTIIQTHLVAFFGKFPSVLLEVFLLHKKHIPILKSIRQFFETFLEQLQTDGEKQKLNGPLLEYKIAFDKILSNNLIEN